MIPRGDAEDSSEQQLVHQCGKGCQKDAAIDVLVCFHKNRNRGFGGQYFK